MVYRIPEAKPALKGGGSPVDVSEQKPALAYDPNSDIIMFSEESWLTISLSWLKTSFLFLCSSMLIFLVMYVTLAASLVFVTSVDSKPQVVARDTFLGGIPSKEDVVIGSPTQAAGENPLDRLKEAALGVPDAQVVTILSGPNDTIDVSGQNISVRGQESGSYTGSVLNTNGKPVTSSKKLGNEYLAQCVSGACTPGSFIIIDDANLYGEIVDLESLMK